MGAFKSVIMTILGLITPQDLKYLTEESREKGAVFQQAAGGETWLWDESQPKKEAQILEFPQKKDSPKEVMSGREFVANETPLEAIGVLSSDKQAEIRKAAQEEYEKTKPDTLDFMLSEREKFRDSEEKIFKQNGLQSYRRNSDLRMYRVSVKDENGKDKTRVTSTLGVLVDKKQA